MSDFASVVYGVDIDNITIECAKSKYRRDNLNFLVGSASNIPLEDDSIDVAISYETLEHHDEHEEMFQEIKRVLRPNGLFVISTPDRHYYTDVRNYNNEFHVKELYKSEFINLVERHFANFQILTQSYLNGNSIVLDEIDRNTMEFFTGDYANFEEIDSTPQFLIAISSDGNFMKQKNSIFDGSPLLKNNSDYQDKLDHVYNSKSYKLGHAILWPLKFLKKIKVL